MQSIVLSRSIDASACIDTVAQNINQLLFRGVRGVRDHHQTACVKLCGPTRACEKCSSELSAYPIRCVALRCGVCSDVGAPAVSASTEELSKLAFEGLCAAASFVGVSVII